MDKVFCQSCAMPLMAPEQHGTEKDGAISEEYCTYCYQNGEFVGPDCTMEEMIEFCVKPMCDNTGMPPEAARAQMQEFFPKLKRWSKK